VTAEAARREVVRQLQGLGLSERQALRLAGMSASTLRYRPRDDGDLQAQRVQPGSPYFWAVYLTGKLTGPPTQAGRRKTSSHVADVGRRAAQEVP